MRTAFLSLLAIVPFALADPHWHTPRDADLQSNDLESDALGNQDADSAQDYYELLYAQESGMIVANSVYEIQQTESAPDDAELDSRGVKSVVTEYTFRMFCNVCHHSWGETKLDQNDQPKTCKTCGSTKIVKHPRTANPRKTNKLV